MLEQIWALLTTFSDEAEQAALAKCKELGFDLSRGVVSLDESFINLNEARDLLQDAIEKKKLIQLPITVQKDILANLTEVSRAMTSLTSGADEVVNLVNSIEKLNTTIWQYGFHNLAGQVLGYQAKLNQLKKQKVEVGQLRRDLEAGLALKTQIESAAKQADQSLKGIESQRQQAEEDRRKANEFADQTTATSQKASAVLATIQQAGETSTKSLATTKSSEAAISAIEAKIKEFLSEIETHRVAMSDTATKASGIVAENSAKTEALIQRLQEQQGQIDVQLQSAAGVGLFRSFNARQQELAKAKKWWVLALAVLVILAAALAWWIVGAAKTLDIAFYVKLSLSVPLAFAITFCTVQYSRERRLEEEYAFKSNISLSLVPYKDLIAAMAQAGQPLEPGQFTTFVIESIKSVFTSPTEKVFSAEDDSKGVQPKVIKEIGELVKTISEAGKIIGHA